MAPQVMSKEEEADIYKFPYVKPEERAWWLEIYDPEEKKFCGRTATNWAALGLFYTIFFSGLAALFSICMYGLVSSVDRNKPTYELESSLIGTNPGLGYRPYSSDMEKTGSTIWYIANNKGNVESWTSQLDDFLKDYRKIGVANREMCADGRPPASGNVCGVPLDKFGPCTKENGYSYNQSSPCVFIKLNRIFNWVPAYYNDSSELPKDMDENLVQYIKTANASELNTVWVSCQGESVADREVVGPITYYPTRGFPGHYYPFTNTKDYLSPLVAIHFERPAINTLINVECRAWAKNIIYERARSIRAGSVHFELLID